jgi:hypothetical protein
MVDVHPALTYGIGEAKRRTKLVLTLVLMGYSLFLVGCSGLSTASSASSQTSPQPVSAQSVLPGATVGSSYHQVLSVNGGQAPYTFTVTRGELPPGLILNPVLGSISGILTQAGAFTFTITITITSAPVVGPRGGTRELVAAIVHTYTMTVTPSAHTVTVQISPADPSIVAGGKIQFAAAVSNTSNTAVSWSASAGTISSTGLFTAPVAGSATPIMVTASSAAQGTVKASTGVTITTAPITTPPITTPPTSSPFVITTSSVPPAVVVTPYAASLAASGGQPPYQWGVSSGSLPAGLQLGASTGTLSGSATLAGTFTFTVQGRDAASHTAQRSLSLVVSAAASNCGPPTYNCSRTDLQIVQVPSTLPNVGTLSGANTIVSDPDFGNRIVRVTDANTDPTSGYKNRTYETTASGSADDNLWNTDSTLFLVQDTGTFGVPFAFNPSTFQVGRLYVSSYPTTNGLKILPGAGNWSRVNSQVLYVFPKTAIGKYDFTNRTTPPSMQTVFDFTTGTHCLPSGYTPIWQTMGGVSGGDTVIGMAYSNTGGQETGVNVVAYKVGSGCSALNTETGQVTGDWGASGTINSTDRFTVHNVKMSKDGNWLIITSNVCTSGTCAANPYFWQIGTTNLENCGQGGSCGGHYTEGYTHWINNYGAPWASQQIRTFSDPTVVSVVNQNYPSTSDWNMDQHQSWNNVQPGDSLPFFSTTASIVTPFTVPWTNEVIAIATDGSGKTWRFAHNFITSRSPNFSTTWGIGTVSQDGRFFLFSSDWMGKLGSESGATTCTLGSDCRGDVFVLELK